MKHCFFYSLMLITSYFTLANTDQKNNHPAKKLHGPRTENSQWSIQIKNSNHWWVDEKAGVEWKWRNQACDTPSQVEISWIRPSVKELQVALSHGENLLTESIRGSLIETRDPPPQNQKESAWYFYSYGGANSVSFLRPTQQTPQNLCASSPKNHLFEWVASFVRY